MNPDNLNYKNIDLPPGLLASILVEIGAFPIDKIQITPDESDQRAHLKNIIKLKRPDRSGVLQIITKPKSEKKQNLLLELKQNRKFQILADMFEESLAHVAIEIYLNERSHLLSISELEIRFQTLSQNLNIQQKKMFAYFLPWKSQILGDLELTQYCFESVTGNPVKLNLTEPKDEMLDDLIIGKWITNQTDKIGGVQKRTAPHLEVIIGPLEKEQFKDLQPGRPQRYFLEHLFFPAFTPDKWSLELKIISKKEVLNDNEMILLCNNYYID